MKKQNYKKVIFLFSIGILYALIFLKYGIGIPCIFHELTGLYCPGCGISRAIVSLIKLDFYQALRYNLLIFFLIPYICIYFFLKYIIKGKKELPEWSLYLLLVIIIVYFIFRNIPYFSYLAPTKI